MRVARREVYAGRALLLALIAITILPFISIFTTALYPSGSVPVGLSGPPDPQWGNFLEAFKVANMSALAGVERVHRAGRRPDLARHLDDGRASRSARSASPAAACCCCCSCSG